MDQLFQLVRQFCSMPPNANGVDRYFFLVNALNLMLHLILDAMSNVQHRNENYRQIYVTLYILKDLLMEYGVDLREEVMRN